MPIQAAGTKLRSDTREAVGKLRLPTTGTLITCTAPSASGPDSPHLPDVKTQTRCRLLSSWAICSVATPPPPPSGGYSKLTIKIFICRLLLSVKKLWILNNSQATAYALEIYY